MKENYKKALLGWRELNEAILTFNKEELLAMIEIEEGGGRPRAMLINRMRERVRALEKAECAE